MPPRPVVQIIVNPASGGYAPRRIAALARAIEGVGAAVIPSACAGGPPAIDGRATHVCVAGGDGTLRHVARAVAACGRAVVLSVYPLGTVNLIAMEAGYSRDPDALAQRIASAAERDHHAVALNDTHFLACASVGPESYVVARVSLRLKRVVGRFAYAVAFAGLLIRWPRARIRLEADGRRIECEAFHVAKGRFFAGRWRLADACGAEPVMHVVALATARRRDVLRFWWALLRGRPPGALPGVTAFACTVLRAEAAAPLPVQADGDIATALPARLRVETVPLRFA